MSAYKRLECNLQAVQKLLTTLRDQPCLEQVAKTQADNFEKILRTSPIDAEQAASLIEIVMASPFPKHLKDQLVEAISSAPTSAIGTMTTKRVKQQDFSTVFDYLPVDTWHSLANSNVSEEAKLDLLLDLSIGLGARNPSEDTFAMLTALHRMSVDGPEQVKALSWNFRLECNQHTKRVFRRKVSGLVPPFAFLEVLPTVPTTFKAAYPEEWTKIYGTSPPVSCPMGEARVRHVQDLIPRRNTKKAVALEQPDMLSTILQPMLQQIVQRFVQPGSASASSDGLRIQMLNQPSTPTPTLALPAPREAGASETKGEQGVEQGEEEEEASPKGGKVADDQPIAKKPTRMTVEQCTENILTGLKQRDAGKKASAKAKAKASPKAGAKAKAKFSPKAGAKAKANSSPKAGATAKVLPTIEKKSKGVIAKPKPGAPVKFGQCTIMHGKEKWRVTTEANRRYDKAFSFNRAGSWDELVAYCKANA